MGNDDVASVNARREYMGNVTVLVNQKSLSRGARYSRKRVGSFSVSHTRQSYCERRAAVLVINPAEQLF